MFIYYLWLRLWLGIRIKIGGIAHNYWGNEQKYKLGFKSENNFYDYTYI